MSRFVLTRSKKNFFKFVKLDSEKSSFSVFCRKNRQGFLFMYFFCIFCLNDPAYNCPWSWSDTIDTT